MAATYVFLFMLFALGASDSSNCGLEKAASCVGDVLNSDLEDEEQTCKVMNEVIQCLRDAAFECSGEDSELEIEETLQEVEAIFSKSCPAYVAAVSNNCGIENAASCVGDLLNSIMEDIEDEEEMCQVMNGAVQCLQDAVFECSDDDSDPKIKEILEELEAMFSENCPAYDSNCGIENAASCVNDLLNRVQEDIDDEKEMCKIMSEGVECLRDAVSECLADDSNSDIEESLEELKDMVSENCPAYDDDDEDGDYYDDDEDYDDFDDYEDDDDDDDDDSEDSKLGQCAEENKEYIMFCGQDSLAETMGKLEKYEGTPDKNVLMCGMYSTMTKCMVERIGEKCGDEAKESLLKEMRDAPQNIVDACSHEDALKFFSSNLIEQLKKKRK